MTALVEKLDALPLALATTGSYLDQVTVSITEYLRLTKLHGCSYTRMTQGWTHTKTAHFTLHGVCRLIAFNIGTSSRQGYLVFGVISATKTFGLSCYAMDLRKSYLGFAV